MNAHDKSALDRYARRVALADAILRAEDLDERGLGEVETALVAKSVIAKERLEPAPRRRLNYGLLKGTLVVPPDFFDPLPEEELRAWEGE